MMALLDGDDATVQAQLDLIAAIPGAAPSAYGVVELNRCFLALAAGKAVEAEQHYTAGRSMTADVHLPGWIARVDTLGALVAWSRGNVRRAETMLRAAIAETPDDESPHIYLARLLEAKGDTASANAERLAGAKARRFDAEIPAQAQSLFWVDPVRGGLQRRPLWGADGGRM
jgi:predicted Zn-dependent protease